jgi:hypothetical protein
MSSLSLSSSVLILLLGHAPDERARSRREKETSSVIRQRKHGVTNFAAALRRVSQTIESTEIKTPVHIAHLRDGDDSRIFVCSFVGAGQPNPQ